jgi:hypothetical protein
LKRCNNESISIFSRKFSSVYYNLSKEIQPSEVAAMLHYVTALHPDFSFLLMERRPGSLQQMFSDAQDIQHNIQACKQTQNEGLNVQGHESEYEQKIVDWNLEHRIDNIIGPLEVSNANDVAKNYIPLVERGGVDPSHDERRVDRFMYSFVDSQEYECEKQLVEDQVDVLSLFLLDDMAYVNDLSIYDEYDDYDVDPLEQSTTCSLSKNAPFQQYNESNQAAYHNYKEESIESAEGNSLPLCFSSFKSLKENPKIIIEEKESVLMQSHARSMEQNDKMSQHSFHALEDPIACVEIQPYVGNKIEDGFKSGRTTLPLCFASFELLKKNICSISGQGSSKHEWSGDDNYMDNHIKGHVSSDLQSMFNY